MLESVYGISMLILKGAEVSGAGEPLGKLHILSVLQLGFAPALI